MKFNKVAVAVLLLLTAFSANAQFGYNRFANSEKAAAKLEYMRKTRQRSTIGMSFRFASADFKVRYKENISGAPSLYKSVDTSFEKNVKTELNYSAGVFYDWFVPLTNLDDRSILAMTVCGVVDFFKFKVRDANAPASTAGSAVDAMIDDVPGRHAGLMLGLEYKTGGDAMTNKRYKSMFSVGGGLMPSLWEVDYKPLGKEGSISKFKMTPYIKAEAGFLLGIAFKVRADILFGKADYINATNEVDNNRLDVTMKGSMPGIKLSVGIMPFSWDWDRDY